MLFAYLSVHPATRFVARILSSTLRLHLRFVAFHTKPHMPYSIYLAPESGSCHFPPYLPSTRLQPPAGARHPRVSPFVATAPVFRLRSVLVFEPWLRVLGCK